MPSGKRDNKSPTNKKNRKRLDLAIFEKGLVSSRQRARAIIMAGQVLVDNKPVDKAGTYIHPDSKIKINKDDNPYVSRGGLKLEKALHSFKMDIKGLECLDAGASTGGFTDCLIQNGATKVFSVDVGYGQLAWKLRQDSRVVVIERTNIRYMPYEELNQRVDLITIDTSFISLKIVVPAVLKFMKDSTNILALIKPQFEVGKGNVGKGGVVTDKFLHDKVIDELSTYFSKIGLICGAIVKSPILGPKGNKEFIIRLTM